MPSQSMQFGGVDGSFRGSIELIAVEILHVSSPTEVTSISRDPSRTVAHARAVDDEGLQDGSSFTKHFVLLGFTTN